MAAVPSMMFGKWEKTSQSCVLNNDICYKIVKIYKIKFINLFLNFL